MLDGIYQSLICFFFAYLEFAPATFVSSSGQDLGDSRRIGAYAGIPAVIVVNTYILMNTYRWDWLMVLLVTISILLIFFWTGVYSAFTSSDEFYKAAPEIFAQASFWVTIVLTCIVCLLPRFAAKSIQKIYYPYDVDIIREQVRQGKFSHLDAPDGAASLDSDSKGSSAGSSATASPRKHFQQSSVDEDQRPIYPPSVSATVATARNTQSQHGSDGTDYTRNRTSDYETGMSVYETDTQHPNYEPSSAYATPFEYPQSQSRTSMDLSRPSFDRPRISVDRARPSFDRLRSSMDRIRPSFEQASLSTNDFTTGALLTRIESSHSFGDRRQQNNTDGSGRSFPLVK